MHICLFVCTYSQVNFMYVVLGTSQLNCLPGRRISKLKYCNISSTKDNKVLTSSHLVHKSCIGWEREREMFYLTTHSTHFIYSYMVSDIWLRTILIVTKETRCHHIDYSHRLTARVLLYAPSHRQDNTYLCYTSRGALAGTRNSSMGYWLGANNIALTIKNLKYIPWP